MNYQVKGLEWFHLNGSSSVPDKSHVHPQMSSISEQISENFSLARWKELAQNRSVSAVKERLFFKIVVKHFTWKD